MNEKFNCKFQLLLEQIESQKANLLFSKIIIPVVRSHFQSFEDFFRPLISFLKNSSGREPYNIYKIRNRSKKFASEVQQQISSLINSNNNLAVDFPTKYNPNYSFIQDKTRYRAFTISYLRPTISINTKYLKDIVPDKKLLKRLIDSVNDHDHLQHKNRVSILYLKVRPFIIEDKKIIIVEEIQSTILHYLRRIPSEVEVADRLRIVRRNLKRLVKKAISLLIKVLYENSDMLFIVRQPIPKNQRFLYEDYEQYRCGNPFKNKEFRNLVFIISSLSKSGSLKLNSNYQYLYCLKGLDNISQLATAKSVKLDLTNFFESYKNEIFIDKSFTIYYTDDLFNDFAKIFFNLKQEDIQDFSNLMFKREFNYEPCYFDYYGMSYCTFQYIIKFTTNLGVVLSKNLDIKELVNTVKQGTKEFSEILIKNFENLRIFGVPPKVTSKIGRINKRIYHDGVYIFYDVEFNLQFNTTEIFKKAGIKVE